MVLHIYVVPLRESRRIFPLSQVYKTHIDFLSIILPIRICNIECVPSIIRVNVAIASNRLSLSEPLLNVIFHLKNTGTGQSWQLRKRIKLIYPCEILLIKIGEDLLLL